MTAQAQKARASVFSRMRVDDYKFMQIVDAMACINQRVSLIGIVVETSLPKSTKGTDFFCSMKILDDSKSTGIHIHFFAQTMEELPHVECLGDIVVVSQVVVKTRFPEVYALFNKKFSSFALFEGRDYGIKELVPYQISSGYKPREQDKKFILDIRKWSAQHKREGFDKSLFFRDIKGGRCDLICKILHISQVKKDEWMVFIWDGTDTPPIPVEAKFEDEMENPLPLQLEPSPLSRDLLCTFPAVGTVLRMAVDQSNEKLGIKFLKTNRWVRFVNVECEVRSALWCAVLRPFSKLYYLPEDDKSVTGRQRFYDERIATKLGRMPLTSFPWPSPLTVTDHPDVAFMTLMDILTHTEVTYKYKCVVRVVAVFPWRAEDFRSPSGIYRVRLTLEDPTARIHAYIYKEDGVKFLGDFESVDMLTKKRNKLLGVGNEDSESTVARNPPWIQCCLFSYYIDKDDIWGSRNFRICHTSVVA